jgi:hypothetical protein
MKIIFNIRNYLFIIATLLSAAITGCKKYLDTALPSNLIATQDAFVSDNAVSAVVTGSLSNLTSYGIFSGSTNSNLAYLSGLYTDELQLTYPANATFVPYYTDALSTSGVPKAWTDMYSKMLAVNTAIDGINSSTAILYNKNQWLGECYFVRGLLYFYLINIYGDVPLSLTGDYKANNGLSRTNTAQVYQQIIADLQQAQNLLSYDYRDAYSQTTSGRDRPNRYAATALLAKVYLYTGQWSNAEVQADSVINNSNTYKLLTTDQAFSLNGKETIWALQTTPASKEYDYSMYNNGMPAVIPSGKTPASAYNMYAAISNNLLGAFESTDNRYTNWVRQVIVSATSSIPAVTYYFPNKYTSSAVGGQNEIILRLAEIYLIRAEARAQQKNISGAQADINVIRTRAGLPGTTAADQTGLLNAIAKERQVELFTEAGNRFFDLKRTNTIDGVMNTVAPAKGATWSSFMQLWPIPPTDIIQDPNIAQNTGY